MYTTLAPTCLTVLVITALVTGGPLPDEVRAPEEVVGWKIGREVGQVSGVAVNSQGQPVVFHRGPVKFDAKMFDSSNVFLQQDRCIQEDTVLVLDPDSGAVVSSWGKGQFYLPHGITIDFEGNTWLTDIALHQVFKFPPKSEKPSLTLGIKFEPGSDQSHFCKPTSVAVATTGEIFVADGYCNSRIVKFDSDGKFLFDMPKQPDALKFNIPHKLVLIEPRDLLCVADRDNSRVVCLRAKLVDPELPLGTFQIREPNMGHVFAVAAHRELLYTVNNANPSNIPIKGFTVDTRTKTVLNYWGPNNKVFLNPHDIGISQDGHSLYVAEVGPNQLTKLTL